ncbi:MAG TPA: type II secretion system F family protein [Caulobacteraceae bacterium]|jgi:tight adherence protein C
MNTLLVLIVEVLTFGIAVAASLAITRLAFDFWSVRRRMAIGVEPEAPASAGLLKERTVTNPFLSWVQSFTSISDPVDRGKLQKTLSLAGFESVSAPAIYVAVRYGLAIGLPFCFIFAQRLVAKPATGSGLVFVALILLVLGLVGPATFVSQRAAARKTALENEFPDALDLMVVCVDAGLGLESALIRVCQEIGPSHRRIAAEFRRASDEMSAGRARADALRSMADHAQVESLTSFVALLIQTEALGVSVGQTLRTFGSEMRETRLLRGEEKALRIPVLMTLPLVGCILPVIMTSVLLPPMIDVVRTLLPMLTGRHP